MTGPQYNEIKKVCEEIEKFHNETTRVYEQQVKVYTKEELLHKFDEVIKEMNDIADEMAKIESDMVTRKETLQQRSRKIIEEADRLKDSQSQDTEEQKRLLNKYQQLLKEIKSLKCEMEYANGIKENAKRTKEKAKITQANAETTRRNAESGPNLEGVAQMLEKIKAEAKEVEQEANGEWDKYYMDIACLAALRSKDPSTPVGACIAHTKSYQIVGIGYNSMPYVEGGNNDEIFPWKGSTTDKINHELKYPYVVHAAVNAIASKTRESIEGCTIYLTHCPDKDCVHAIIKAKIKEVVYCMFTRHDEDERETKNDMEVAKKILERNGVEIRKMKNENVGGQLKNRIDEIRPRYTKNKDKWPTEPAKDFIPWETFFMEIALLSKERSDHSEYKVGACVVSPKKQVLAIGYNAYPEGMIQTESEDDKKDNKEESEYISHAEYKAILGISPSVQDCTLYVTKYPCHICAKVIVQSGIKEVIYDEEGGQRNESYKSSRKTLTTCLGAGNIRSYDKKLVTRTSKQCQSTVKDQVILAIIIILIIFVCIIAGCYI